MDEKFIYGASLLFCVILVPFLQEMGEITRKNTK